MKWRLTLLISASVLLAACQEHTSPASSQSSTLRVLPVEYYSRSAITGVEVKLLDESGKMVGSDVSYDGEVVFENLVQDAVYTIQIGEGDMMVAHEVLFEAGQATEVVETKAIAHAQALAVPIVKQLPELPHGCEITSLTAVLQYYGADVSKTEMVEHMPREAFTVVNGKKVGPDPHVAYGGNPTSAQGTYVFAEPIVKAATSYLNDASMTFRAENISGSSLQQLKQYVAQGIPIVSWVTLDLSAPKTKEGWLIQATNQQHPMFTNLHAVVIIDIRDGKIEVMDPLKGYVTYNQDTFFASYQALGEQAMIVY